jgi:hypothetical protein
VVINKLIFALNAFKIGQTKQSDAFAGESQQKVINPTGSSTKLAQTCSVRDLQAIANG